MTTNAPESDLSRAEVRDRLLRFAAIWDARDGKEQQEAQQFLVGLLGCYGIAVDDVGPLFEQRIDIDGESKRADLLWNDHLLIEMKSATETDKLVERHLDQAYRYWEHTYPHPTFVVLCSFRRLVVFEPGRHGRRPRKDVQLIDLPDQLEALDILRGHAPDFDREAADLEREAVGAVSRLHRSMVDRGVPELDARNFTLQATWCLFAEDLGMFGESILTSTVEDMLRDERLRGYDPLGQLFAALSSGSHWPPRYAEVPFANGGLFAQPAHVDLTHDELLALHDAARADWRAVEPSIFGGLLQSALGEERRSEMAAHYTPEAEIQKIVGPTIVAPWEARIAAATSVEDAVAVVRELAAFRVLDPACGCGNFLYVSYREVRRLHRAAWLRLEQLCRAAGRQVPTDLPTPQLENMLGIEKDEFAVALSRVVLWIGHKLAIDRFDLADPALPLPTLNGIQQGDALHLDWPETDAIVGNPPFHGASGLRKLLQDDELRWLKKRFGVGIKDYCVYWFRRTHDHLRLGQRAGLVGTNSVSQNLGRAASLDYIVNNDGTITDAVSSSVWPGDAAVHVSVINWVRGPAPAGTELTLDGVSVDGITSSLRDGNPGDGPVPQLVMNDGWCFEGASPKASGFILETGEALRIIQSGGAQYRDVVRPYLGAKDITSEIQGQPARWAIDFGLRELREAKAFPLALEVVESRVRPIREANRRAIYRERWWTFAEPRPAMRDALSGLSRFIAAGRHGKRILFTWQHAQTLASDATNVFAFDDDYHFGVLSSVVHISWAKERSSTLKGDIRYTPTSAFQTFPFPTPDEAQRDEIGQLAVALHSVRDRLSLELQVGMTKLYNEIDDGDHRELLEIHSRLDEAVCAAYGWPKRLTSDTDERNSRLTALVRAIDTGAVAYAPFAARDNRGTASLF